MIRMNTPRIGQVHEIEIGPPLLKPAPKFVKQPARIEMIENEIAKLEKPDQTAMQVLLVAELGQPSFVVVQLQSVRPRHASRTKKVRPPQPDQDAANCHRETRECLHPSSCTIRSRIARVAGTKRIGRSLERGRYCTAAITV